MYQLPATQNKPIEQRDLRSQIKQSPVIEELSNDFAVRNSMTSRQSLPSRQSFSRNDEVDYISPVRTSRSGANFNEDETYSMDLQRAKKFLESELIRITTKRDELQSEYQRLPSYGRAHVRLRNEALENELDECNAEISSTRRKMKDIGIL